MNWLGIALIACFVLALVTAATGRDNPAPIHVKGPPQNPCGVFEEPVQGAICGRHLWDS